MNIGHISGGTHAGWRVVRQAHVQWECRACSDLSVVKLNPGYLSKCPCGNPRPN